MTFRTRREVLLGLAAFSAAGSPALAKSCKDETGSVRNPILCPEEVEDIAVRTHEGTASHEIKKLTIEGLDSGLDITSLKLERPTRTGVMSTSGSLVKPKAPTVHTAERKLQNGSRGLFIYNRHTGEWLGRKGKPYIYYADGTYFDDPKKPGGYSKINEFMRCHYNDEQKDMIRDLLDIIWQASMNLGLDYEIPFIGLSFYRSPKYNAWLRSRREGVAKNSRHLLGEAADLTCERRSVDQIWRAAHSQEAGGVGLYTGSGFVHMDCGPVRTWGT